MWIVLGLNHFGTLEFFFEQTLNIKKHHAMLHNKFQATGPSSSGEDCKIYFYFEAKTTLATKPFWTPGQPFK